MNRTVQSISATRSGAWGVVCVNVGKVDLEKLYEDDAAFLNQLFALLDIQLTFDAAHEHKWVAHEPIVRRGGVMTRRRSCACGVTEQNAHGITWVPVPADGSEE